MTSPAGSTLTVTGRYGLLQEAADLSGHLQRHGPLPVPDRPDPAWRQSLVAELEASGLSGRGGAAFPSFRKLAAAQQAGPGGVVVVNGMEGEPASDKDKVLLTRVPHLVLDGAQLLAAGCGAERIVVAVPVGRDAVASAVQRALDERTARHYAPLGEALVRPPDRYVAGEESALARWIDVGSSLPSFRPDKGVPLRIGSRPALILNTETLAHVARIGRDGSAAFTSCGLPEEPGTTLVTITGGVEHPGVVEVERGTALLDIAQRATMRRAPLALLVGGYGGTWVGPEHFATPYASIPLRTIGASTGVGAIAVLAAPGCGVAETARVLRYAAEQSAGQCGPCVFGLPAIARDLLALAQGQVDPGLATRLTGRLQAVSGRGACRHPDGAVSLARSALAVFADDVAMHLRGQPCLRHAAPTQLRFPAGSGS